MSDLPCHGHYIFNRVTLAPWPMANFPQFIRPI